MKNGKIVFIDMDGTLYQTENDVIQPSALDAIAKLKEDGFQVWAATGRPLNMMKQILERVQFDGYVLINGGYVLDDQFRAVETSPVDEAVVDELIELAKEKQFGLMFHFGDATYIYSNFYPVYEFAKYTNSLEGLFYDPTMSYHHRHPVYNCVVVTKDPQAVQDFVAAHPDLRLDLINIKTDGFAYDIFPARNDKSGAIDSVLARQGLQWKDTVTIGDSTNDLKMLSKAGLGIAMGSAIPEVQAAADFVTTTTYTDGIANALEKIEEFASK